MASYKVMVDDNFAYMDPDARREHGVFPTMEDAIAACKGIVDDDLRSFSQPGVTPDEIFRKYQSFGGDPFIVAVGDAQTDVTFSAWTYAEEQSKAISRG